MEGSIKKIIIKFLIIFLLSTFLVSPGLARVLDCNSVTCLGPINYYNEIGCKPVYKKPGDCCAYKYDCPPRIINHCYINDREYSPGESISKEDSGPCETCTCEVNDLGVANILCLSASCPFIDKSQGCHLVHSIEECCPTHVICQRFPYGYSLSWLVKKTFTDEIKCEIDGHIYYEGESFTPSKEKNKRCFCSRGYRSESNTLPYCYEQKGECRIELLYNDMITINCPPVYDYQASRRCPSSFRCREKDSKIIHRNQTIPTENSIAPAVCNFEGMTLQIGDELEEGNTWSSRCMKCICETPPVLTCRRSSVSSSSKYPCVY